MVSKKDQLIISATKNPKLAGKEVIVIGEEIHLISTKSLSARKKMITELTKKHPGKVPVIAYIPKRDTLILILK